MLEPAMVVGAFSDVGRWSVGRWSVANSDLTGWQLPTDSQLVTDWMLCGVFSLGLGSVCDVTSRILPISWWKRSLSAVCGKKRAPGCRWLQRALRPLLGSPKLFCYGLTLKNEQPLVADIILTISFLFLDRLKKISWKYLLSMKVWNMCFTVS